MKTYLLGTLLVAVLLPLQLGAAPLKLSSNVQIDILDAVPTQELWGVTTPDVVEAAAVLVDTRMFDSEAAPRSGKWHGCAIVMIGTSDLGIRPVAMRIWTTNSCSLVVNKTTRQKSLGEVEFDMRLSTKEVLRVRVTKDLVVKINGITIGRIE